MPSEQSSTQYDAIADAYATLYPPNLHPSPFLHARLEAQQLRHAFLASSPGSINLQGKCVLDLAGGNGHYGLRLLAWGAASVVSADISEAMARRGRAAAAELGVGEERLRFVVADAMEEGLLVDGKGEGGRGGLDVLCAAWLLNYARDAEGLERMWTNMGRQLRGGGWFVGLVPPPVLTEGEFEGQLLDAAYAEDGAWGRHGTGGRVLEKTVAGFRVETTLGVPGRRISAAGQDVRFEHYHMRKEVLEDSLVRTGMFGAMEWRDWVIEDGFRKEYPDLADDATLMPHCRVCVARRLS